MRWSFVMRTSIDQAAALPQRERSEMSRAQMAKAGLRKADTGRKQALGMAIRIARMSLGWNLNELAAKLPPPDGSDERDPRQVARWEDGKERPHFDLLFDIPELCEPLTVQVAKVNGARVSVRIEFPDGEERIA